MRRPVLVPALAMIAAIAIAVPALAQPDAVTPQLQKISQRALVKSSVALRVARQAKRQAREALERPAVTQTHVVESALAPTPTTTQVVSASEAATVTTDAEIGEFEAKGGPSLQVTVPSSGLIEVWAQVDARNEEGGAVALYEDGNKVPGISNTELCGDDAVLVDATNLFGLGDASEFTTVSTPPVFSLVGCGSAGAPGPVLLSRPPGPHTYELRYSECSCPGAGDAEFRNRVLRVAPRP